MECRGVQLSISRTQAEHFLQPSKRRSRLFTTRCLTSASQLKTIVFARSLRLLRIRYQVPLSNTQPGLPPTSELIGSTAQRFLVCCQISDRNGRRAAVHVSCTKNIASTDSRLRTSRVRDISGSRTSSRLSLEAPLTETCVGFGQSQGRDQCCT